MSNEIRYRHGDTPMCRSEQIRRRIANLKKNMKYLDKANKTKARESIRNYERELIQRASLD